MGRTTSWKDEYTLLCEQCGYVVEGLDVEGACPECGKAISESLPERRVGTAWQQKPGVGSLVRTWWMTVRYPVRTLDNLRFLSVDQSSWWLRSITWLATSFVSFVGFLISTGMVLSTGIKNDGWLFEAWIWSFTGFLIVLHVVVILTFVEQYGIVFLAKRHGFRVGRDSASIICSHGSVGWLLAALLGGLLLAIVSYFESIPNRQLDPVWYFIPITGAITGFLFFETFAWLGLRRCRYANRARPGGVEGGEPPAVAS